MLQANIVETNLDFTNLSERSYTGMIVIHHTGESDIDASAAQIHQWHLNQGWAGIGYHYVIRKDGTIERGRPEWAIGSHAYGENYHTIGIHLSGDFEQAEPTDSQIQMCAILIANLCEKYGIPIDREHIVGHGELMATSCPGKNLQALLDDGTITGKANWYRFDGNWPEPSEGLQEETEVKEMRYDKLTDVPEWGKATIEKLTSRGILKGDGTGLDLSRDMLRLLVILDRAEVFEK